MCGRFNLVRGRSDISEAFGLAEAPEWEPRYNVAPTQQVLLVRAAEAARACALVRWGLVPKWATAGGPPVINAKAETVAEKPMFRAAFKSRRCLVPATGFYEWVQSGKRKQPWLFTLRDGGLFAFAGLWESGPQGESACVITTTANDLVRGVHDRMPVILLREAWELWLDPASNDTSSLRELLRPYPAAEMTSLAVNPAVGSPRNEGPRCVEPAAHHAAPAQGSLF